MLDRIRVSLGYYIRRGHQIYTSMWEQHLGAYKLTSQQLSLLYAVYFFDGDDLTSYARNLGIDKTSAGRFVRLLEERKYISTQFNPEDRRQKYIHITALGIEVIESATPLVDELEAAALDCFSEEEKETFLKLLRKFVSIQNGKSRAPAAMDIDATPLKQRDEGSWSPPRSSNRPPTTYSEQQRRIALEYAQSGLSDDEIVRKLNISDVALSLWKKQNAHRTEAELKRTEELMQENTSLKFLIADLFLEVEKLRQEPPVRAD